VSTVGFLLGTWSRVGFQMDSLGFVGLGAPKMLCAGERKTSYDLLGE
nr:hypothetical protein [Tanacetum cinerariifolium]